MKKTTKVKVAKKAGGTAGENQLNQLTTHMRVTHRGLLIKRVAIVTVLDDGFEVAAVARSLAEAKKTAWTGEQNGWRTSLEDAIVFGTPNPEDFSNHITVVRGKKGLLARVKSGAYQDAVRKRRLADSI